MAVLLHLSDIHFRKHSGSAFDIDTGLRNELELDAKQVYESLGPPAAILVGGDIAYSGNRAEYDIAKVWLHKLCSLVGTTFANIWSVPGNHDVDQNTIKQSAVLSDMQTLIRSASPADIDAKLLRYMGDSIGKVQLYNSITEFNTFAEAYGFGMSAEQPTTQTEIGLNDGSVLRINGLNSTIVSNHLDNTVKKIVLGQYQLPKREYGVTNLVLCHHPPDWWHDDDVLEEGVNHNTHIQLYGHKHRQVMRQVDNSLRVVAGAVHPDRQETGWQPRYNWLKVTVSGTASDRKLVVDVYPRVWGGAEPRFIPDTNSCGGQQCKTYTLSLEKWEPLMPATSAPVPSTSDSLGIVRTKAEAVKTMNSPLRVITFRLFELPYLTRLKIAQDLNLVRNEDSGLRDYEVFRNVLQRATDEGHLVELWDKIEAAHADGRFPDNPFRVVVEKKT